VRSQDPRMLAAITGPSHLARRFNQLNTRLWQEAVGDELTGPQFTVLGVLNLEGPLDQGTLGQHSRLDKSTVAPLVERLRQRGLVEIARDSADRRRKVLRITDQGRELAIRLTPTALEVGEAMLAPLDPEERELFLGLLRRVV
jgi:DNA-binding MarR family transcriptional regulator